MDVICCTRSFAWHLIYLGLFLLACFIIGFVLIFLFSSEYVANLEKELSRVTPFYEGARKGVSIGDAVLLVALYTFIYFMTKKVLHKVFFKPYKLFKLEPSITCIRAKMVWLYNIVYVTRYSYVFLCIAFILAR